MSGAHDAAQQALTDLLAELPWEFSNEPPGYGEQYPRESFKVIKRSNVRRVHQALWDLQEYLDVNQ